MKIYPYDDDRVRAYAIDRKYRGLFEMDLDSYLRDPQVKDGYAFMYTKTADEIKDLENNSVTNPFEGIPSSFFQARYIIGIIESSDSSSYGKLCYATNHIYPFIQPRTEYASVEEWNYGDKDQVIFVFLGVPVTTNSLKELSKHPFLAPCAKKHVRQKRLTSLFNK